MAKKINTKISNIKMSISNQNLTPERKNQNLTFEKKNHNLAFELKNQNLTFELKNNDIDYIYIIDLVKENSKIVKILMVAFEYNELYKILKIAKAFKNYGGNDIKFLKEILRKKINMM